MKLIPMTEAYFHTYLQTAQRLYAAEKVKAGNWREEDAETNAKESYEQLLPDGVYSNGHYLYEAVVDGNTIGMIWFAVQENSKGFIYDVLIDEAFRGRGYGRLLLKEAEVEARRAGITALGLHVFAHNERAVQLYQSAGYDVTNIIMEKKLEGEA